MKKILFAIIFILGMKSLGFCSIDFAGNGRPTVWRSSYTETADTNTFMASDTIHFHGIQVSSGVANSYIYIYNNSAFTNLTTTVTKVDLSSNRDIYFDISLSSGLIYNKVGTAKINILWDWIYKPTPGFETKGR